MKVIDGQMEQLIVHGNPSAGDIAPVLWVHTGSEEFEVDSFLRPGLLQRIGELRGQYFQFVFSEDFLRGSLFGEPTKRQALFFA